MFDTKKTIQNYNEDLRQINKAIWEYSETRFATEKSSNIMIEYLKSHGFTIKRNLSGMKHAFIAKYGNGSMKIAFLAEFDALEGMSQKAYNYKEEKDTNRTAGHACGHNLLGTGSLTAALALKKYIDKHNADISVYLYGCPAEESGYGKAFLARDGYFNDLDFALTWHPYDLDALWGDKTLAVKQFFVEFKGKSSHASASPELGRSALDASELMNIGVNYLREHIDDAARIHYAYHDAGGGSANAVQSYTKMHYFVRHQSADKVNQVFNRITKIAEGAALMTETDFRIINDSGCSSFIANDSLSKIMYEEARNNKLDVDHEDLEHSKKYPPVDRDSLLERLRKFYPNKSQKELISLSEKTINTELADYSIWEQSAISTDVGDVSWNTPCAQMFLCSEIHGTNMHSWQWVDNGLSDFAHKASLRAGEIMANTAIKVYEDPEKLKEIKEEFHHQFVDKEYQSLLSKEDTPII